jgi:DNA-directed RNA polymerase specialized sigma24 family protein
MKLDLYAVQVGYSNLIWSTINYYFRDAENMVRDRVRDAVFDKLGKVKLRKEDARAIKSLVYKTTRSVCIDLIRRKKPGPRPAIRYPRRVPRGRPPIRCCHENRTSPRPDFYRIESVLAGHGLNEIKHLKLYCAWCEDLSIKEIAKRFRLSPMQAKGRLQYTRKKIISLLRTATKETDI